MVKNCLFLCSIPYQTPLFKYPTFAHHFQKVDRHVAADYSLKVQYHMKTKQVAERSFQTLLEISYLVEGVSDDPKTLKAVVGKLMNYYGGSPEDAVDGFLSEIEQELSFIRSGLEEAASSIQQKRSVTK